MKLSRFTPASNIEIKMPRWKQRMVGIAKFRVGQHNVVNILATNKEGERYYPDELYGSGEMIRQCEVQVLPSGVELYLVPISKLEPLERTDD